MATEALRSSIRLQTAAFSLGVSVKSISPSASMLAGRTSLRKRCLAPSDVPSGGMKVPSIIAVADF